MADNNNVKQIIRKFDADICDKASKSEMKNSRLEI